VNRPTPPVHRGESGGGKVEKGEFRGGPRGEPSGGPHGGKLQK
jgi:hypothetical protein